MCSGVLIIPCGWGDGDPSDHPDPVRLSAWFPLAPAWPREMVGRMDWRRNCNTGWAAGLQAGNQHLRVCLWASRGRSLLGQYIVFSVLILMQLGGCTWSGGPRGVEGGHYFPELGPVRLCGEGCAQSLLRRAQPNTRGSSHKLWKGKFSSDIVKIPLHSNGGWSTGSGCPGGDVKA